MPLGMEVDLGPDDIVLDGEPPKRRGGAQHPLILAHVLWPNGCMAQDATRYGGRPRPRPHCVTWGPGSPKKGSAPNFRPMSVVAKRLHGSRCHFLQR